MKKIKSLLFNRVKEVGKSIQDQYVLARTIIQNERGANLIEYLGGVVIAIVAVVIVVTAIRQWFPGFWNTITDRLQNLL